MSVTLNAVQYEGWIQSVIPHALVAADLEFTHRLMSDRDDPFGF